VDHDEDVKPEQVKTLSTEDIASVLEPIEELFLSSSSSSSNATGVGAGAERTEVDVSSLPYQMPWQWLGFILLILWNCLPKKKKHRSNVLKARQGSKERTPSFETPTLPLCATGTRIDQHNHPIHAD